MKSILKVFFITTMIYLPLIANPFATQLITILTDESEPAEYRGEIDKNGNIIKLGSISQELYVHLLEKETIIVVNSAVLHFLMKLLKKNDNPLDLIPKPIINTDDFITRKVSDNFFIIVSKNYVKSRPNYQDLKNLELTKIGSEYSAEELCIGLKLENSPIKKNDFFNPTFYKSKDDYLKKWIEREPIVWTESNNQGTITYTQTRTISGSWISEQLIKELPEIFIPLSMYEKLNIAHLAPISVIIASGHGSKSTPIEREIKELQKTYGSNAQDEINKLKELQQKGVSALLGGQIAGLDADNFGDLVGYIVKNIQTSLLFFNTCYGSEVNVKAALQILAKKEKQELKDLKIPFIIISGAISNAPAYSSLQTIEESRPQKKYITKPLYKKFIETLNKKNASDDLFIEALNTIYSLYGDVSSYNNIPIIKYPNELWRPLNMPDKILLISPQFVEKYENQTSVDLSGIFTKQKQPYPRVVLLSAPNVPFELIVSGNQKFDLPVFISYGDGDAIHHIQKLSMPSYNMSEIINNFFSIKNLEDTKTFLIDELKGINDIPSLTTGSNQAVTFKNVIILHQVPDNDNPNHYMLVKFNYDNKDWLMDLKKKTVSKDTSNTFQNEWSDLLKLVRTSPINQQQLQPTQKTTNQPTVNITQLQQKAEITVLNLAHACIDIAT